jgi:NAD(P)-dependent dehydrogenase (short-subunit alcohol dehydrogenase family)
MNHKPKRVVITGASSGIGKAAAVRFANEGWEVCLVARRQGLLEEIRRDLPGANHLVVAGSYDNLETADRIRDAVQAKWGKIDSMVNNAGVFLTANAVNSSLEEWRKPFDSMVNGAIYMSRLAAELINDGGRIVHVTSIHGDRVENNASAYAMAKAAINHFCRGLALELAPRNILVNAVAPGFVDTPMSYVDGVNELESEWFIKNYVAGHHLPLRRAAQPEEIAGAIFFLAGPDSSYITGQVITVDGGLTIAF